MSLATALMLRAVQHGNGEEVKRLARGADVNANNGMALSMAAAMDNIDIVEALLESGANANLMDEDGQTALLVAAENGSEDIARLLVERGEADVRLRDCNRRSPLSLAAENGHISVVKMLLEKGSIVDLLDELGRSPLSLAATKGHAAVVKLLLDHGARIDLEDNHGETALFLASAFGEEPVVDLLLDAGAKVDKKNEEGETALLVAVKNGHRAVVNMLLAKGAVPSIATKLGQTALDAAAIRDDAAAIRDDLGAIKEPLGQLLENPPVIQTQATGTDKLISSKRWPAANSAEQDVCKEFRAFVLEKLSSGNLQTKWVSIYSLIYDEVKSRKELSSHKQNVEDTTDVPDSERWTPNDGLGSICLLIM